MLLQIGEKQVNITSMLLFCMFFFMAVFSTVFMKAKIILALIAIAALAYSYIINESITAFDKQVAIWMIIFLLNNAYTILVAVMNRNPYATYSLSIEIVEPFFFFVLIMLMQKKEYNDFITILKILTFIISVYNLLFFMALNGLIPLVDANWFAGMWPNYGGFSIGFIKYHSNNITWLVFLVPFTIADFILHTNNRSAFEGVTIILGLINVAASMRTGFIIAVALSPFITVAFAKLTKIKYNKNEVRLFLLFTAICITVVVLCSVSVRGLILGLADKVLISLSTSSNSVDNGGYIRMLQIRDLLDTWKEKPLLGWGFNTNAHNVIRSDIPGSYEMQYFAMLMQRGLIGSGILLGLFIWLYVKSFRIMTSNEQYGITTLAIIVGHLSVLLANATNPYIGSFDRLIIIFIPLITCRILLNDGESEIVQY